MDDIDDIPAVFVQFCTAVVAYRSGSSNVKQMLQLAIRESIRLQKYGLFDQAALRTALWHSPSVRTYALPPTWQCSDARSCNDQVASQVVVMRDSTHASTLHDSLQHHYWKQHDCVILHSHKLDLRRDNEAVLKHDWIMANAAPACVGIQKEEQKVLTVRLPFTSSDLTVVANAEHLESFWQRVSEHRWEMELFRAMNQEVTKETVYIGFGEWNGVTGLWAMQRSIFSILLEPDPQSLGEICSNLAANIPRFSVGKVRMETFCVRSDQGSFWMTGKGESGSRLLHKSEVKFVGEDETVPVTSDGWPSFKVCLALTCITPPLFPLV